MANKTMSTIHAATILDETVTFNLNQLCQSCHVHAELIIEMVDQGLLDPTGSTPEQWRFAPEALDRSQTALHLQQDLGVNFAGTALILDLLDEIQEMRAALRLLEHQQRIHN